MNRIIRCFIFFVLLFRSFVSFSQQEIYDECQHLLLQGQIQECISQAQQMYYPEGTTEDNLWYYLHMISYDQLVQKGDKVEEYIEKIRPFVDGSYNLEKNYLVYYYFAILSYYNNKTDTISAHTIIDSCKRVEELMKNEMEGPALWMILSFKGTGLYNLGKYKEAKDVFSQAINILGKGSSFNETLFIYCCQKLSDIYHKEGNIDKAIAVLSDCYIKCSSDPDDMLLISDLCRDLAKLYKEKTDFDNYVKYQKLSSDYVSYYSKSHRRDRMFDFDAFGTACHAAINYFLANDYTETIEEVHFILNNFPEEINKDKRSATSCFLMLGVSYQSIGELYNAIKYFDLTEQLLKNDPNHDELWIRHMGRIGEHYQTINNHEKALSIFEIVKREADIHNFGEEYAKCLIDIAYSNIAIGQYLMAKLYIDSASTMLINIKSDPEWIAETMTTLVNLYNITGFNEHAVKTAKELLQFAKINCRKEIQQSAIEYLASIQLRSGHISESYETIKELTPDNYSNFEALCIRYENRDHSVASEAAFNSQNIIEDVSKIISFLSYDERENFWLKYNYELAIYNTILYNSQDRSYYGQIYNNALFSKGLLLRTTTKFRDQVFSSNDETAIFLFKEIADLRRSLNENHISQDSVRIVKETISTFEKELYRRIFTCDNTGLSNTYDWKSIKRSLKKGEAAIEFIQLFGYEKGEAELRSYAAIVVKPSSKKPELIELCTDNILGQCNKDDNDSLFSLVWKPIEPYLKGVSSIYYSPIGRLNSICFSVLHNDGGYLCDRYKLRQVSSTGNISDSGMINRGDISNAILYGDIQIDADSMSMIANATRYKDLLSTEQNIVFRNENTLRSGFDNLPQTRDEVESIAKILRKTGINSIVLFGDSASEESFKYLHHRSPSIIHVATHGFSISRSLNNKYVQLLYNSSIMPGSESLMVHSGLVFSGGNNAWVNNQRFDGCEDGLLTAAELSNLDLSNTKIAVLSACETGTGHLTGEGIYGLQRAFKLAGVNTLIVTLRPVSDDVANLLMVKFYTYWTEGEELHSAFNHAISDIRKDYPDPKFWSPFVIID